MTRNLWSRWIPRGLSLPRAPRRQPARRSVRLGLESLEERITPTTYNVSDVASLENAINTANSDTGPIRSCWPPASTICLRIS